MLLQSKETAVNLSAQTGTELEVLKRIVATLFALTCLAERASRAPRPVRAFVLWVLRRAEAVVRECVAGQPMAIRAGNESADALELAASFRALARALGELAVQYQQFSRRRYGHDDAGDADDVERNPAGTRSRTASAHRQSSWVNLWAAPCPDTS